MLSPAVSVTLPVAGVTSVVPFPLLMDKLQRSDFAATPLMMAVSLGTSAPVPSAYVNVTFPFSTE